MEAKNDIIVTSTDNNAGAVVWWSLSGEVEVGRLAAELEARGVAIDVARPTAHYALRRAAHKVDEQSLFLRALPGRRSGWALVREHATDNDSLEHNVELRTWVDGTDDGPVLRIEPFDHPRAASLRAEFARIGSVLDVQSLSGWLTQCVIPQLVSIALRDNGGFYFMPQPSVETFRRVVAAIEACGGSKFMEIPAMRSEQAVGAVVGALQRDVVAAVAELETELTAADGGLTERGVKTRQARCERLLDIVQTYERSLDISLASMREEVGRVKSALVVAALSAGEGGELFATPTDAVAA
jgi:hypothetical protein